MALILNAHLEQYMVGKMLTSGRAKFMLYNRFINSAKHIYFNAIDFVTCNLPTTVEAIYFKTISITLRNLSFSER